MARAMVTQWGMSDRLGMVQYGDDDEFVFLGREVSRANLKDMYFDFGRLVARASEGVYVFAGELLGSGSAGTGCILELGPENVPWLEPGDVVELEVERLGLLRNTVVAPG